eukprot:57982_1
MTMSITVFLVVASCVVQLISGTIYTDYAEALTDLRTAHKAFLANGVTEYVYNFQMTCYCEPCSTVAKYIVIKDGAPTYVEYDGTALAADSSLSCGPFTSPLSDQFKDISYYYAAAITHAETAAAVDCSATPDDIYCGDQSTTKTLNGVPSTGAYIEFVIDETYSYPTTLRLVFNRAVIADAGSAYSISCLSPLSDVSSFATQCSGFSLPSEGDECGTPGEDCTACKSACMSCTDDSGLSYGCCASDGSSTCTFVENSLGELLCSAFIPQDLVCPVTPECGGFIGIQCAKGYCVDDPSDDCDPENGGADCGGICVSEGDSCDGCSGDRTALCACALCDDDSGDSYGCCGCEWTSDGEGDVSCNGAITSKEDVCPDVVDCICTEQYDPYCCDGTVYSNLCGAGCDGFTADDCVQAMEGECPSTCGGLVAVACDKGLVCVDDPTDDCDPENGGADCGGICVQAVEGGCPSTCGGFAGFACDKGLVCVDDPTDDCDPENGGADCGGICVEEATTTAAAETTTSTENGDYCDHFDNSASTIAGFDHCKFCICREKEDHPHCQKLYELYLDAADDADLQSEFYTECAFTTYPDLANADGEQCDWIQLRAKDAEDLTECGCSALYCNGNLDFPVDQFGSGSGVGVKQMCLSIAFVTVLFWWM